MYRILLLICLFGIQIGAVHTQKTASWFGILKAPGIELPIGFHIYSQGDSMYATMESPSQTTRVFQLSSVLDADHVLVIKDSNLSLSFMGTKLADSIVGTFQQFGNSFPLTLYTAYPEVAVERNRPQTPKGPFPYNIDTVLFTNPNDKVTSRGVLTRPPGVQKSPLVILVSGSGSSDMDVTIMDHVLFAVIADSLTRAGISVFRFDDRGVGGSGGYPHQTTTITISEDVMAAKQTLYKQFGSFSSFGVMGHSQGGNVALRIAANAKNKLDFMLLLAAPGAKGSDLILEQYLLTAKQNHIPDSVVKVAMELTQHLYSILPASYDSTHIVKVLHKEAQRQWSAMTEEEQIATSEQAIFSSLNDAYNSPSVLELLQCDPLIFAAKVTCPTLLLNGALDVQVSVTTNFIYLKNKLQPRLNNNLVAITYPYLNHLFQYAVNGTIDEYGILEETINSEVLVDMITFIKKYSQ